MEIPIKESNISSIPAQNCSSYRLEMANLIFFSVRTEEKEGNKTMQNQLKIKNRKHEGKQKTGFRLLQTFIIAV